MVGIIGDRVEQLGEGGEYRMGRNGSGLIQHSELQGDSPLEQLREGGEYRMGRNGSGLIQYSELQGDSHHLSLLDPNEQAFEMY
jgi:hypothetical protein